MLPKLDFKPRSGISLEVLAQAAHREALEFIRSDPRRGCPNLPLVVTSDGVLNASISMHQERLSIVIGRELLELFWIMNVTMVPLAASLVNGSLDRFVHLQAIFDGTLRLVFAMQPPLLLVPAENVVRRNDGFDDYQRMYLRSSPTADRRLLREFEPFIKALADEKTLESLLAWQVKFLIYHEYAHYINGDLQREANGNEESIADKYALRLFTDEIRLRYRPSQLDMTPFAVVSSLLTIAFVEDLVALVNRAIYYAILDAFKAAYVEIQPIHPGARGRLRDVLSQPDCAISELNQHLGGVMEGGIMTLKLCIRLGLVDVKYLKWYARVRALELTMTYATRQLSPDAKRETVKKYMAVGGWDSADLKRGPLVDSLFSPAWMVGCFVQGS